MFLSFTQVLGAGPDPKEPGEFKVSTREYSYRLLERSNIASKEILGYHWHPNDSALRDPHLHIRCVPRVHFPTSRVCVEDVVSTAHQVLRCTSKDEAFRVDGHHREEQTSFRENGHMENSTPAIARGNHTDPPPTEGTRSGPPTRQQPASSGLTAANLAAGTA